MLAIAAGIVAPPTDPPPKPAAYELSWTAPPECPTADVVRERVAALAAEASGGSGVMFVGATVTAVEGGYSLELRTEHEGRRDDRTVEARQCDELGDSTALVVAISLHPPIAEGPDGGSIEAVAESESTTEADPVETSAPVEAEPVDPDDPSPGVVATEPVSVPARVRQRSRSPQRLALRLAPGFEVGGLPGLGGATQAALALVWPPLRIEVVGAWLWPRRGDSDPPALYQAGLVGARGCGQPGIGRVAFPLCLGVEGGALRADSRSVDPQRNVLGPWFGPVATAGITVAGDHVGLWSAAELALTPVRTRVFVDDEVSLSARLISFRLFAGLEIFFSIDSQGAGQRR